MEFNVGGEKLILKEPENKEPIRLVTAVFGDREYHVRFDSSKRWFIDDVFGRNYKPLPDIDTQELRAKITHAYALRYF